MEPEMNLLFKHEMDYMKPRVKEDKTFLINGRFHSKYCLLSERNDFTIYAPKDTLIDPTNYYDGFETARYSVS